MADEGEAMNVVPRLRRILRTGVDRVLESAVS
jgi:hypothetical protein